MVISLEDQIKIKQGDLIDQENFTTSRSLQVWIALLQENQDRPPFVKLTCEFDVFPNSTFITLRSLETVTLYRNQVLEFNTTPTPSYIIVKSTTVINGLVNVPIFLLENAIAATAESFFYKGITPFMSVKEGALPDTTSNLAEAHNKNMSFYTVSEKIKEEYVVSMEGDVNTSDPCLGILRDRRLSKIFVQVQHSLYTKIGSEQYGQGYFAIEYKGVPTVTLNDPEGGMVNVTLEIKVSGKLNKSMMFGLPGILDQSPNLFDPFNIPSNIILDSSVSSKFIFATGTQISTWFNDSDNAFNAVQSNAANRPLFVPGIINGWGAVQFDGVNDSVNFPSSNKGNWSNKYSGYTVAMLIYPEPSANTCQIIGTASSATNALGVSIDILPTGELYVKNKSSITTGSPTRQCLEITTPSITFNNWHIIIWSGFNLNAFGASFVRIDGGNNIYDSITDLTIARTFNFNAILGSVSLRVGGYNTNQYFKGYIADFRYLDHGLNTGTINLLEGYYAHKYGLQAILPSGHPYKTSSPTSPDVYYLRDIPTKNI
jgi:hypothetical protein